MFSEGGHIPSFILLGVFLWPLFSEPIYQTSVCDLFLCIFEMVALSHVKKNIISAETKIHLHYLNISFLIQRFSCTVWYEKRQFVGLLFEGTVCYAVSNKGDLLKISPSLKFLQ